MKSWTLLNFLRSRRRPACARYAVNFYVSLSGRETRNYCFCRGCPIKWRRGKVVSHVSSRNIGPLFLWIPGIYSLYSILLFNQKVYFGFDVIRGASSNIGGPLEVNFTLGLFWLYLSIYSSCHPAEVHIRISAVLSKLPPAFFLLLWSKPFLPDHI